MNTTDLNPFEYFALYSLTKRRPLFRWEEQAVTPEVMESLRQKALVERDAGQWVLTRAASEHLRSTHS